LLIEGLLTGLAVVGRAVGFPIGGLVLAVVYGLVAPVLLAGLASTFTVPVKSIVADTPITLRGGSLIT
jgi:hypothetical protein